MSVVNALSSTLSVQVRQDGKVFTQRYHRGKPEGPLEVVGQTEETGTTITWMADEGDF